MPARGTPFLLRDRKGEKSAQRGAEFALPFETHLIGRLRAGCLRGPGYGGASGCVARYLSSPPLPLFYSVLPGENASPAPFPTVRHSPPALRVRFAPRLLYGIKPCLVCLEHLATYKRLSSNKKFLFGRGRVKGSIEHKVWTAGGDFPVLSRTVAPAALRFVRAGPAFGSVADTKPGR